jgi:hypothetical protein
MEREGQCSFAGEDRRAAKERNRKREKLIRERAGITNELDSEQRSGRGGSHSQPTRKVRGSTWARYLYELWQTVARSITRPILQLARGKGRRWSRRKRARKDMG